MTALRAALQRAAEAAAYPALPRAVDRAGLVRLAPVDGGLRAVHQRVLYVFAEIGHAPSTAELDEVAAPFGTDGHTVLTLLHAADFLRLDAGGAISAAYPFSAVPIAHVIKIEDGPAVFSMCAIDALGITAMLGKAVTIQSVEPGTDHPITVTVPAGKGRAVWKPATAVVFNCQLGVFLAYASPLGRALIDAELYLPKSWMSDPARCAEAGIPETTEFATKPVLARAMLRRALDAGMPVSWATADEAYGQDGKFRRFLEQQQVNYVVAVPKNQVVAMGFSGDTRADTLAAQAPPEAWKRLSAGGGAKGPRLYDWALGEVNFETKPGYQRWLLVRRNLTPNAKGELELAYYLCHGPVGTSIADLVRVAGARWAIEECFQAAKNETGLDHYQVRRYDAWHRHITLAMLAHAYLAATAAHAPKARQAWSTSHQQRSAVSWHT